MAIVIEVPSLFPESLLDRPPEERSNRCWWAIYTKARQEKALARDLVGRRVPFYLPLVGLEGTVLRRRGETRLLVSVDFLQKGASMAIDDCLLEPIG